MLLVGRCELVVLRVVNGLGDISIFVQLGGHQIRAEEENVDPMLRSVLQIQRRIRLRPGDAEYVAPRAQPRFGFIRQIERTNRETQIHRLGNTTSRRDGGDRAAVFAGRKAPGTDDEKRLASLSRQDDYSTRLVSNGKRVTDQYIGFCFLLDECTRVNLHLARRDDVTGFGAERTRGYPNFKRAVA